MTYKSLLHRYAKYYRLVEDWFLNLAVYLNLDEVITGVQKAKEAAMLQNLEMLIENIQACTKYKELKACKDMYQMICLSYPEFAPLYSKIVGDCLIKHEQKILESFNKYKCKT